RRMLLTEPHACRHRMLYLERLDNEPLALKALQDDLTAERASKFLLQVKELLGMGHGAYHEPNRRERALHELLVVPRRQVADSEEALLAKERVRIEGQRQPAQ